MNPYHQKFHRGRSLRRARVEILPLIDVMFLLVAFFMVISISMVMQKGIFVDLSPAKTADSSMEDNDSLVVSVNPDGTFFLNKEEISQERLSTALKEIALANKERAIVINADRQARHENVIEALDIIRETGLHNVIFSVEPKE